MRKKEEIFEYCVKCGREVTAREIVEALYPGKGQPHVNSEITSLVKSEKLVRNDEVRPYRVRLPFDGEIIIEVKNHSRSNTRIVYSGNNNRSSGKTLIGDSTQSMETNMRIELLELIEEFGRKLTKYQYNQYVVKLRDYLVPYLEKNHSDSNLKILFENEFTRKDIINSTIYYIENNKNIKRISAIDDFLIALNRFFSELIIGRYNNQNVRNLIPFNSLCTEINNSLITKGILLLERESFPPIDVEQYKAIIAFLEDYKKENKLHAYQDPIIIKLMLLYGFSHDRLASLKIDSYDRARNTLSIVNPIDARIKSV